MVAVAPEANTLGYIIKTVASVALFVVFYFCWKQYQCMKGEPPHTR